MTRLRLIASLAALVAVAPASAAIITYNVSVSGGAYSTSSYTYDYGTGVDTYLGELAPAISPLALTGRFTVDTTQGTQGFPFPFFPFQSSSGSFINSTIAGDQPTPSLATSLTGTNGASLTAYDYAGGAFYLNVSDFAQTLFYDNDGNVTRAVNEFFEHTLAFSNVSEFTYLDGKAFPKLTGPGISAALRSTHGISDYDYSGGGILVTSYTWTAEGIGTLGFNATATDGSTADVPEPATLALFGVGILGVGLRRRRVRD